MADRDRALTAGRGHVAIVMENVPLQRDIRVQRQSRALLDAGYRVSIVCQRGRGRWPVAGASAVTYRPPSEGASAFAFAWEYAYSVIVIAYLLLRTSLRDRVDVVQLCNPPDVLIFAALPLRLCGTRLVFDHHDPAPEMYVARYGRRDALHRLLLLFERATFGLADRVITTNGSMRDIATGRGGVPVHKVAIVRNGPDLKDVDPAPDVALRRGHRAMVCWLGDMGPDDGVDLALRAWARLVHDRGRSDCLFVLMGDGEIVDDLHALAAELGVEHSVHFTGWVDESTMHRYLATADVALAPDPKNERSDRSTMIKVMDYMAFALPVVAFDVVETRRSAGSAGRYVEDGDVDGFAAAIDDLLGHPEQRTNMGRAGRARLESELAWDHQRLAYLGVVDELCSSERTA